MLEKNSGLRGMESSVGDAAIIGDVGVVPDLSVLQDSRVGRITAGGLNSTDASLSRVCFVPIRRERKKLGEYLCHL